MFIEQATEAVVSGREDVDDDDDDDEEEEDGEKDGEDRLWRQIE
jgi:hypothetical protein